MANNHHNQDAGDGGKRKESKAERSERKAEAYERGDIANSVENYNDKLKEQSKEQKISGRSKVTGKGQGADGKGGFSSAKDLLGDLAHETLTKDAEKKQMTPQRKAQIMAEFERDGYIVGKPQEKAEAAPKGSAEDTGKVTDYKPKQNSQAAFSLGMNYEEGKPENKDLVGKIGSFAEAAVRNATNPKGWQDWFDGELQKAKGIAEGLNEAKEETKATAVAGFKALTDGTVANFLANPNAINDPLFKAVGSVFDAISSDPNATNKALEALGNAVMKASNDYSNMPKEEQGKVIGKVAFGMINPEGSTEGAEVALKVVDKVATQVDKAVVDTISVSLKAAEKAAQRSPEMAQLAKQRLLDYLDSKGLLGPKLEYAGVPDGYFEGMQPTKNAAKDNYMAMSSESDAGGFGGKRPMSRAERAEALERNPPSEIFRAEMAKAIDNLEPHLRDYLEEKGVEIKTCRRITDLFPDQKPSTMGCYSIKENSIYIAEEVRSGGQWVKNFDVDFNLRHESGHAFSYTKRGYEQLSADVKFQKLFAQDIKNIPQDVLKSLDFDINSREGIEFAREEVFADSFAHATGCATKNRYSQLIREHFPSCRTYF